MDLVLMIDSVVDLRAENAQDVVTLIQRFFPEPRIKLYAPRGEELVEIGTGTVSHTGLLYLFPGADCDPDERELVDSLYEAEIFTPASNL